MSSKERSNSSTIGSAPFDSKVTTRTKAHGPENTESIRKSKFDIDYETYNWGERCSSSSTRSSRAESVVESAFTGGGLTSACSAFLWAFRPERRLWWIPESTFSYVEVTSARSSFLWLWCEGLTLQTLRFWLCLTLCTALRLPFRWCLPVCPALCTCSCSCSPSKLTWTWRWFRTTARTLPGLYLIGASSEPLPASSLGWIGWLEDSLYD